MGPTRLERVLRQHLETERLLGTEALPVGSAASLAPPPEPEAVSPVAAPPTETPLFGGAAPARDGGSSSPPPGGARPGESSPLPRGETGPVSVPRRTGGPSPAQRLELLQAMDVNEVRGCTRCDLCRSRTQTVFGEGDPAAELMFIGEGPGETEDQLGRPFVGRAGELLDKMIVAMGLRREQVYIANVVKCRPPGNRTPLQPEVDACWDYLRRQIQIIEPRVIVTLGGPATKQILQTSEGITRLRGVWRQFTPAAGSDQVIPVMPTFHPAFVLRAYTPENRRKVWEDLKKVMEALKAGQGGAG